MGFDVNQFKDSLLAISSFQDNYELEKIKGMDDKVRSAF